MEINRHLGRIGLAAAAGLAGSLCAAQSDFVSAVNSTNPIAYFQLDATAGKSQVGSTTYKSQGAVSMASGGAVAGADHFLKLDGQSGMIVTTQSGGVGTAASIMAWVDLAELPSKTGRLVSVANESEYGNDLDLQFDIDNGIKFWTAAGGNVSYTPPPATLVNQWHMIVVSLDMHTKTRAIYWDGKLAASDKGGASAAKKNVFTIGASPVFTGRNLKGGIEQVALWDRALKPAEVSAIYAAAGPSGGAAPTGAGAGAAASGTGAITTTAKVEAEDAKGAIQFKREEQIAFIFLSDIEVIEHECQLNVQRACSMSELMTAAPGREHLKIDLSKADSNYTYTLASGGMAWEAHANAKKPGLKGFCFMSRSVGTTVTTYSATGKSGWVDPEIGNRGVEGDSFRTQ
jgi:hypothetical protein